MYHVQDRAQTHMHKHGIDVNMQYRRLVVRHKNLVSEQLCDQYNDVSNKMLSG